MLPTPSKSRNYFFQSFILFLCIYLYIFSPRFDIGFQAHAGYLVTVLVIGWALCRGHAILPIISAPAALLSIGTFLFLAVYHVFIASLYSSDPRYFSSIQVSLISYLIFGFMLSGLLVATKTSDCQFEEKLIDKLLYVSALSIFINSCLILLEYTFPDFKVVIESMLVNDPSSNINYSEHAFRLRGLSAAGGAGLSVVNAFGVLLFIFLMVNKIVSQEFSVLGALIIVLSNIFTGRTGLLFGILFFIVLLFVAVWQLIKNGFWHKVRGIALIAFLIILIGILFDFDLDPEVAAWAFEWVDGLQAGELESTSSDELRMMLFLPENLMHLLLGIGFFEGVNDLYSRTDSGYVKTILSVGAPLALWLYSTICLLFFQVNKISSKYHWLIVVALAFMLLVEWKEPVMYQNYLARVVFLLSGAALFLLIRRRKW